MIIAFASMGFAEKTKAKSSLGSEVQEFYLNKHIQYVSTCVFVWTASLSCGYFALKTSEDSLQSKLVQSSDQSFE